MDQNLGQEKGQAYVELVGNMVPCPAEKLSRSADFQYNVARPLPPCNVAIEGLEVRLILSSLRSR